MYILTIWGYLLRLIIVYVEYTKFESDLIRSALALTYAQAWRHKRCFQRKLCNSVQNNWTWLVQQVVSMAKLLFTLLSDLWSFISKWAISAWPCLQAFTRARWFCTEGSTLLSFSKSLTNRMWPFVAAQTMGESMYSSWLRSLYLKVNLFGFTLGSLNNCSEAAVCQLLETNNHSFG